MKKVLFLIILLNILGCKSEECNCEISNEIAALNDSISRVFDENQSQISEYLDSFSEEQLNRNGNDTYRLIIDGAFGYKKIWRVKVEEARNILYVSEIDDNSKYAPHKVRFDSFELSNTEIYKMDKIFQDSCFWAMLVFEDNLGLDGETWILESNRNLSTCGESGYKIVSRWSPFNTKFNSICESIMLYDTIWAISNRRKYLYDELQDITTIDTSEFIKTTVNYYDIIGFNHGDLQIVDIERIHLEDWGNEIIKVDMTFEIFNSSTFPNKRQLYLDTRGNLLFYTNAISTKILRIGPNEDKYLLCTYASAKGNGGHKLYELNDFSFRNVYDGYKNYELKTYDIHQDLWVYREDELDLKILDINEDGYNDLRFMGDVLITMGVTQDSIWYDSLIGDDTVSYSLDNPFIIFEVVFDFIYNEKSENYEVYDSSYYRSDYIKNLVYDKVKSTSANNAPPSTGLTSYKVDYEN